MPRLRPSTEVCESDFAKAPKLKRHQLKNQSLSFVTYPVKEEKEAKEVKGEKEEKEEKEVKEARVVAARVVAARVGVAQEQSLAGRVGQKEETGV